MATLLESVVRGNGGVPATIGILGGVAKVGMSPEEIIELASTAENKSLLKVSRRDLGYICGMVGSPHQAWHARTQQLMIIQGLAGKKIHGGTTISGTMILSELAGIKIFGTGGLGIFTLLPSHETKANSSSRWRSPRW